MQPRCGAKSKQNNGEPCKSFAMRGSARCRIHGGKVKRGTESASFKHGRYTKVLGSSILTRYIQSEQDPELLSHRDEIRLMDAHLAEMLGEIQDQPGDHVDLWSEVREVVEVRKRLLEAETKRLKEIDGTMRLEDALLLITQLEDSVKRRVYEYVNADIGAAIIQAIGQDLAHVARRGASGTLPAQRQTIELQPH